MTISVRSNLSFGLHYKHIITFVNDDPRVVRMTLQVVASLTMVILMTEGTYNLHSDNSREHIWYRQGILRGGEVSLYR
jgi:hypothetical protein